VCALFLGCAFGQPVYEGRNNGRGTEPSQYDGETMATSLTSMLMDKLSPCLVMGKSSECQTPRCLEVKSWECVDDVESSMIHVMAHELGLKRSSVIDELLWKEYATISSEGGHRGAMMKYIQAMNEEAGPRTDAVPATRAILMKHIRELMSVIESVATRQTTQIPEVGYTDVEAVEALSNQAQANEASDTAPNVEEEAGIVAAPMPTSTAGLPKSVTAPTSGPDAEKDCPDAAKSAEGLGDAKAKRVTPDYTDGPWYKNKPAYPFDSRTARPNIVRARELLAEVADNVAEVERALIAARKESEPIETRLLERGNLEIATLTGELASATRAATAHGQIAPTQAEIKDLVENELAPELRRISRFYQTDAEVRYPFAERTASFTTDLQKAVRSRDSVCERLQDYLPPNQLATACGEYDVIVQRLKAKIDQEMATATEILNKNSADLDKSSSRISATEEAISQLREKLIVLVDDGKRHVPGLSNVKRQALADEKVMLVSIKQVSDAQADLLAKTKSLTEDQLVSLQHISSLLGAMDTDATEPPENASLPAAAQRTVQYDGDIPTAPIFQRSNSPEVGMPPSPIEP